MIDGLTPTNLGDFQGLYSRGPEETCPEEYGVVFDNMMFFRGGFETRWGTAPSKFTTSGVVRWYPYQIEGQANRVMYLTEEGRVYDSLYPSHILEVAGMIDFSMVVFNDRAYLTPHNGNTGLVSEFVYVYQGQGFTATLAGGLKTTGMTLSGANVGAGYIETGRHLYALAYETNTGFITRPGPNVFLDFTSNGTSYTRISGLTTWPSNIVALHILATKIVDPSVVDQLAPEYFFIPGATVVDQSLTTTDVNFYDDDLTDSADYLFDQLETIPSTLGLAAYQNSLVGWGIISDPSIVYVSKAGQPESISAIEGGIEVDKSFGGGVQNCLEYRGQLIMSKKGRIYAIANNGQEPAFWGTPVCIDTSVGTTIHGIAMILDEEGNTTDRFVLADRSGVLVYDGTFNNILTDNISSVWDRVNRLAFNKVQAALDTINKTIYVTVPLDGATTPNYILFGDYSDGMQADSIKWSLWSFPYSPSCIGNDVGDDGLPKFKIGSLDHNIYTLDSDRLNDNNVAIPNPTYQTSLVGDENVAVTQFGCIRLRVVGSGTLRMQMVGLDSVNTKTLLSLTLSEVTDRLLQRDFDFQGQGASLKIWTESIDEWFRVTRVTIFSTPIYLEEPS